MSKTCMLCGRETVHRPDVGTVFLTEKTFECEECDARYYYTDGKLEAVGFIEPRPDNQGGYWRRVVPIPEGTLLVVASEKYTSKNFCLKCNGERIQLSGQDWKDNKGNPVTVTRCEKCKAYYHADENGLQFVTYKFRENALRSIDIPQGCLLVMQSKRA